MVECIECGLVLDREGQWHCCIGDYVGLPSGVRRESDMVECGDSCSDVNNSKDVEKVLD